MWALIVKWLTGDLVSQLTKAYEARLKAQNETDRLVADALAKQLEAQISERRIAADVVTAGMQHRIFWVVWAIAAVPTAMWFGWGMLDSTFNGKLPDVAALPPQLKEYADVVFANIFYVGGGVAGAQVVAAAIRGRK